MPATASKTRTAKAADGDENTKEAETQPTAKKDPSTPSGEKQRVTITSTRLRTAVTKIVNGAKDLTDAITQLDDMLYGKDESKSPIVAQVRELRDLLTTVGPVLAEAPGRIETIEADVKDML